MSTQGSNERRDGASGGPLPDTVPFALPRSARLAWELGSRVVDEGGAAHEGAWTHPAGWRLSVFSVTDHTALVRVRTPVGRERFYSAARLDVTEATEALGGAAEWRRTA